ncbi:hypothetical protein [Listeria costaricensis]|uniref:hypothetical protein n=1 Tax=Listeria costaricensis TaxID=2026604 RepID=UPI000C086A45|nr:hypothetical protein [Listeria costaricensis]
MKRDLRINFGVLEDVRESLYQFMRALEEMKGSVQLIDKELANGSGKSVEAIRESKSEVVKAIDTYKEQVNDIYVLICDYVMDMGRYIRPQAIGAVMQVDRNDIWMNMGQIEGTNYISVMKSYVNTSSNVSTYDAFANAYTTTTEPSVSGQHNQRIVDQIEEDVHYIVACIKNEIQDLWDIYNQRIVPFENTDDDYKARSERLYDHYTSWQERASDIFNTASQGDVGFLVGVWDGIVGIVSGLWSMAVNVSCYTISGIVYLVTAPFGSTPQEVLDYLDGANETIGTILNDPCLIFEGMGQNISDTYEEKGIMCSIGAAVPDIALDILVTKGLGKLGKAGKVGDAAEDVADVGKYADELAALTKELDDIWDLPQLEGGNKIEEILAKTEYQEWWNCGQLYDGKFPTIDFQLGNEVVSLKSLDPRLPSYTGDKATKQVLQYLNDLDKQITVSDISANKTLDLRIPKGTLDTLDLELLQDEAIEMGINLEIKEI